MAYETSTLTPFRRELLEELCRQGCSGVYPEAFHYTQGDETSLTAIIRGLKWAKKFGYATVTKAYPDTQTRHWKFIATPSAYEKLGLPIPVKNA